LLLRGSDTIVKIDFFNNANYNLMAGMWSIETVLCQIKSSIYDKFRAGKRIRVEHPINEVVTL